MSFCAVSAGLTQFMWLKDLRRLTLFQLNLKLNLKLYEI